MWVIEYINSYIHILSPITMCLYYVFIEETVEEEETVGLFKFQLISLWNTNATIGQKCFFTDLYVGF